jgi:hypothetical protein
MFSHRTLNGYFCNGIEWMSTSWLSASTLNLYPGTVPVLADLLRNVDAAAAEGGEAGGGLCLGG